MSSPAAPALATRAGPSRSPPMKAALVSTSAIHASSAITVTESIPLSIEAPDRGSMRW